ncbi:hypothetical protein C8R45DRAFT_1091286 [Mycena sanguinolenta]|nr:hypothetical protein C8R45DRAFT_1091286 [Mycena sanguinolenta]
MCNSEKSAFSWRFPRFSAPLRAHVYAPSEAPPIFTGATPVFAEALPAFAVASGSVNASALAESASTGAAVKEKTILVNKTLAQRIAARKEYDETVAVSYRREEMLDLRMDTDYKMADAHNEDDWHLLGGDDNGDGWEDISLGTGIHTFPPGEEALLQSHAGGEAIMHQLMEGMRPGRGGHRTRSFRIQKQVDAWQSQLPLLTDAYLQYKDVGAVESIGQWPLKVIGFNESTLRFFSHPPDVVRSNQTLIRHGYIVYRQIHCVCPRYTIDSLAKTLCHLHQVPRKAHLAEQLTTAYDAFLAILQQVDLRVQEALGRDETWDWKNLSWLGSIDGNNSLKLVDSTFRAGNPRFDNRKSTSFRWLTPQEVDQYMNEVRNSAKVPMTTAAAMEAVTKSLRIPPATVMESLHTPPAADLAAVPTGLAPEMAPRDSPADIPDDGDVAWLNVNELNPVMLTSSRNVSTLA